MRNVTISVPDDVYRNARVRAAEQGVSLSALVADYLRRLSEDRSTEFAKLRELQRHATEQVSGFSARDRLSRDEVHDRATVR
ncbi:MAG: DUF6364 family protein [Nocardioides sp.]|uniref:DUF6364 family protein n=1 Tax=Nocardioides sp. TaxID=35761 RepID=UPI0039E3C831